MVYSFQRKILLWITNFTDRSNVIFVKFIFIFLHPPTRVTYIKPLFDISPNSITILVITQTANSTIYYRIISSSLRIETDPTIVVASNSVDLLGLFRKFQPFRFKLQLLINNLKFIFSFINKAKFYKQQPFSASQSYLQRLNLTTNYLKLW